MHASIFFFFFIAVFYSAVAVNAKFIALKISNCEEMFHKIINIMNKIQLQEISFISFNILEFFCMPL